MSFNEKLIISAMETRNITCMGIDPQRESMPNKNNRNPAASKAHLVEMIFKEMEKRKVIPSAFKINHGFFEVDAKAYGNYFTTTPDGNQQLAVVFGMIREKFPGKPIIFDFKRGDIGNSSENYAQVALNWRPDAVTVSPYMGTDSVMPFIEKLLPEGIGVYILNRTSNPGAKDFQDLTVMKNPEAYIAQVRDVIFREYARATFCNADAIAEVMRENLDMYTSKVYQEVTMKIREWAGQHPGGIGAVVGATSMPELQEIAAMYSSANNGPRDDVALLIPGVGKQGGSATDVIAALNAANYDMRIARINNSRGIIHPWGKSENAPENWPEVVVDKLAEMNRQTALPLTYFMAVDKHMNP